MKRAAALRLQLAKNRYHDKTPSNLTIALVIPPATALAVAASVAFHQAPVLAVLIGGCGAGGAYAAGLACQDWHRRRELHRALEARAKLDRKQ